MNSIQDVYERMTKAAMTANGVGLTILSAGYARVVDPNIEISKIPLWLLFGGLLIGGVSLYVAAVRSAMHEVEEIAIKRAQLNKSIEHTGLYRDAIETGYEKINKIELLRKDMDNINEMQLLLKRLEHLQIQFKSIFPSLNKLSKKSDIMEFANLSALLLAGQFLLFSLGVGIAIFSL